MDEPEIVVAALSPAHAAIAAEWRYEGPWSVYDPREGELIGADKGYHAIIDRCTGGFLGYLCIGEEARVPGLDEAPDVVDVGIGLDPAFVGHGRGRAIVGPVLDWVVRETGKMTLRAVVQAWNERSLRLCSGLGFEVCGHHVVEQDGDKVDYVVLLRSDFPATP